MSNYAKQQPAVQPQTQFRLRFAHLAIALAFIAILGLSQFAAVGAAPVTNGTIPPGLMTELRGPITEPVTDVFTSLVVAGVPIDVSRDRTRINTRVDELVEGNWARVQGHGDGNGGILAHRVKVMSPQDFARLRGTLDAPIQAGDLMTASVDGITITLTADTRIVGNPHDTASRVDVKLSPDDKRIAFQIVNKANPRDLGGKWSDDTHPGRDQSDKDKDKDQDHERDEKHSDEESEDESDGSADEDSDQSDDEDTADNEDEADDEEKPDLHPGDYVRFVATIDSAPVGGPMWEIGGLPVKVDIAGPNPVTDLNERKGDAESGAKVKVVAITEEGGTLFALEIVVIRAADD